MQFPDLSENHYGVVVDVLDCNIVVNAMEFELTMFTFELIPLGKV